ncbi:hypothetical protein O0L34_g10035 [Tuta absoluta]|nr:hypothetical protein O0L34_g10035 [Tuta absoluta]
MATHLQPHQVGFGTTLGCEAAIHATRAFAMNPENTDCVIVKVDLKNAFNSVERDTILAEVKDFIPSLYPFFHQCYAEKSHLSYCSQIPSQVGAQQGDPLGPLIFSLAIHKVVTSLKSSLNVWYLDDGTIGGTTESVAEDVRTLVAGLSHLGLQVNPLNIPFESDALLAWATTCPGVDPPVKADVQRAWDDLQSKFNMSELIETHWGTNLARIKAAICLESGAWLQALPSPQLGTHLDNDSLRVAVALRLGCRISFHLTKTTREAGSAAEYAASQKHSKYSELEQRYIFIPFAVETGGPWGKEAKKFARELGRRLRDRGCDRRSGAYLIQHISLAIQRGNAAGVMGTFEPGTLRGGLFD